MKRVVFIHDAGMARPARRSALELSDGLAEVGYCGLSTERQGVSGPGLEAERVATIAGCSRRSYRLVERYDDVASGRAAPGRFTWHLGSVCKVVAACRPGLLVHRASR